MPTDNESWLIEAGDRVIVKTAGVGGVALTDWESLVYALWWADYAMRNGESLEAAAARSGFHASGLQAARRLGTPLTRELFALPLSRFEAEYLDRFEAVCCETRAAEQDAETGSGGRSS
jgi:hypothetical protein